MYVDKLILNVQKFSNRRKSSIEIDVSIASLKASQYKPFYTLTLQT